MTSSSQFGLTTPWQQMERSGLDPRERKEMRTGQYARSDNGQAFITAIEEQGYILAKGDKRVIVVVDIASDVHSLNRQITTAKAKEIREKFADIDLDTLPSVDEARDLQRQRSKARREAAGRDKAEEGRTEGHGESAAQTFDPALEKARAELLENQQMRREEAEKRWQKDAERQGSALQPDEIERKRADLERQFAEEQSQLEKLHEQRARRREYERGQEQDRPPDRGGGYDR